MPPTTYTVAGRALLGEDLEEENAGSFPRSSMPTRTSATPWPWTCLLGGTLQTSSNPRTD
jgi:hypothetical protein